MSNNVLGIDIGTGNIVCARHIKDGKIEVKSMRNMFLPISPEELSSAEIANTQLDYVEIYDGDDLENIAIVGEDSYRFANIFGQSVRRPMQKGVISTKDIDAIDIMAAMFEKLVGGKVDSGFCVYSVPAQAIDVDIPPVLYHEKVFGKIFSSLGYESKPMNEAMSIIYSECSKENFTGIGISFGAGLTNVACSYKGTPTITFSLSRGGDWIDQSVADSVGKLPTRVTSIKEKDLSLTSPPKGKKEERRVKESLQIYYDNLIRYVIKAFIFKFKDSAEGLDIDEKIPIILSGGTSKCLGFKETFESVFKEMEDDFPYDVSEIRMAKDPLNAVAIGNLVYAMWDKKRKGKEVTDEEEDQG
jgi:hypothetical protein